MQELDGFEATRIFRAREAKSVERIPIVALTANAMIGDRQRSLNRGMDDFLSKPFSRAEIVSVLRRCLEVSPIFSATNLKTTNQTFPLDNLVATQKTGANAPTTTLAIFDTNILLQALPTGMYLGSAFATKVIRVFVSETIKSL